MGRETVDAPPTPGRSQMGNCLRFRGRSPLATPAVFLLFSGCSGPTAIGLSSNHLTTESAVRSGDQHLLAGELPSAAASYEEALRSNPRHPRANSRLGQIHARQGNFELAAEYFAAAIKAAPDSFDDALALARCYARLASTSMDRDRYLQAAARAYRHAQSLDERSFIATLELAQCYRHLGEDTRAIEALRDAEKLHPGAAQIHAELAAIYHRAGEYPAAIEHYKISLRDDREDARLESALGNAYAALARQEGPAGGRARQNAVYHLRRALELDPQLASARGMLRRLEPYEWQSVTIIQGESSGK